MKNDPPPKILFSTDPDWKPESERPREAPPPGAPAGEGQTAEVLLEKRQKGKVVTLVRGIRSHPAGLEALAKKLKAACGAGGTAREGVVEVQGDHREKVAGALEAMGFRVRKR
jgi:translation initiation factor 1